MPKFLLRTVVTIAVFCLACTLKAQESACQQANTGLPKGSIEYPRLEDAERHLGPFSIEGQNFAVVLHEKRMPGARDPRFAQTLETIELRDDKDTILIKKRFGSE